MPAEPRWLTATTEVERRRGDRDGVCDFVEGYCTQTKLTVAGQVGEPLVLRGWQRDLLRGLYARRSDGRRRFRTALIGMPRKNGKSALGSSIALAELFCGPDGGEVYSCAADRDQARIVFGTAKRMIEMAPELDGQVRMFRDAVEVPSTGSVYRVLSSEAFTKEGLSPSLVVFDEVHAQPNDELWNVMNLGSGARIDPIILGITTAGVMSDRHGSDTVCYRLFQHGIKVAEGEVDDPSFFFAWWSAPDGADYRSPGVWEDSNPGYGDIVDPEDFESTVRRTPENEYRTKRLNQWVSSAIAWLPHGAWDELERSGRPEAGSTVVLGFDGSYSDDSSALVGCTVPEEGETPAVWLEGLWERPERTDGWRVPRSAVMAAVDRAMTDFRVLEFATDPPHWESEVDQWTDAYGEIVEPFRTSSRARMAPACNRLYTAVMEGELAHDHDPALSRHLRNCVTKDTPDGTVIVKDAKGSPRKIDAAVAAVVAHERAMWHAANRQPAPEIMFAVTSVRG